MALLGLGLALAGAVAPAALARPATGPMPSAYRLDLSYSARGAGALSGSETIEIVNRGTAATDTVWLRLWGNGPDRCRPRRVSVTVLAPARAEGEAVRCTALRVRLAQPLAPGAATTLGLRVRIRGRRAGDRFGRDRSTALFGNVIPTVAVTDSGGLRLPPYVHGGESFYSTAARWEATLDMPASLRAASTGAAQSDDVAAGRRRVTVSTPSARDFGLALGRFRVQERRVNGVRVRVYSRGRPRVRRYMARAAARSLRLFASRFGAYGSPELDVVDVRNGLDGMEYPELVFAAPYGSVIAHEVAHQWWYGLVGNDQYREPWLDESLASYSEFLYGRAFGDCRTTRLVSGLPGLRRARLDWSMRRFAVSRTTYSFIVYAAGGCALRSLEGRLGATRMRQLLRLLVARHRGGVMTKSDFLAAVGEVAPPGFRLRSFLRRARLSPG